MHDPPADEVVILSRHTYRVDANASEQEQILALIIKREDMSIHLVETTEGKETNRIVLDAVAAEQLKDELNRVYAGNE